MILWAFKQVALDGGRAFAITAGGRLLEGQLFSGQWRWTLVEIDIPDEQLGVVNHPAVGSIPRDVPR